MTPKFKGSDVVAGHRSKVGDSETASEAADAAEGDRAVEPDVAVDVPARSNDLSGVLTPGSQFGVYSVGACIGEGGMARIYQAEHAGLRRQVALKVLIDGFARDHDGRERFLREARIAAAIKHPNVVNIFDVGVHEDIPYLVMELLEGQDLERFLESKGTLDEGLIIDIMVPVVAGLSAVHEAGIVHRDLKPGNIFLARGRHNDLEPKLLDFGISKATGADQLKLTANRALMGTPFYISPEGLHGHEMTALSDQYSLGVVMYECATGCTPFNASTFVELFKLITVGQYISPTTRKPELSKRLERIITRAMSLEPEKRFTDLREMGRELLLLAGQRTRITWGLSFGEPKDTLASKHDGSGSTSLVRSTDRRPNGRLSRAIRFGLVPLVLIGLGLTAWVSRRVVFDATARARPTEAPRALGRSARGAEETTATASVPAEAVPPPSAAQSTGPSAGDREPMPSGGPVAPHEESPSLLHLPEATGLRRVVHPAAATRKSTGAPEPDSEWALPSVAPPSEKKPASSPLGANGAPIFD